MKELEVLRELEAGEGGGEATQELYARNQTGVYRPDPVVNVSISIRLVLERSSCLITYFFPV